MQQQRDGQELRGEESRAVLLVAADLRRPEGHAHRDEQLPERVEGEPLRLAFLHPFLQPLHQQPEQQQLDAEPDQQPDRKHGEPDLQSGERHVQPEFQPDQQPEFQQDRCEPDLQPDDEPDFEPDDQPHLLDAPCERAQDPLQLEQQCGAFLGAELGPSYQLASPSPRGLIVGEAPLVRAVLASGFGGGPPSRFLRAGRRRPDRPFPPGRLTASPHAD